MSHYVYILECADKTLYVGYTTNLEARQQEHCDGRGGGYTAARLPVHLVYSESCDNAAAALKRERQVKRWTRAKKAALIAGDHDLLRKLSPTPRT
jgi:putative endonuclease